MKLSPGVVLAERYRLMRPLGEGGMGEVWAATHVVTGREVALKRLLAPADGREGQARARFVLEAQAACAVEHPNVVEILDFVEVADEPPVIVMELLRGETLATRLARESALSLEQTAKILAPVVSAAGTAHARGIVHRDLKPANIFLCAGGPGAPGVKVLDFGIAKRFPLVPGEPSLRTQTGSTLGTPCYMAPEQAVGDRIVDHRADIWSLGVILYECLSGVRPVEGENAAQIVMRLLSTGIIPIAHLVPGLPADLVEAIGRMLSREPSLRPSDLREARDILVRLSGCAVPPFAEPRTGPSAGGGIGRPALASADLGGAAASVRPRDRSTMGSGDPARRVDGVGAAPEGRHAGSSSRRLRALGIAALGVLGLAGSGIGLARSGRSSSPPASPGRGALSAVPASAETPAIRAIEPISEEPEGAIARDAAPMDASSSAPSAPPPPSAPTSPSAPPPPSAYPAPSAPRSWKRPSTGPGHPAEAPPPSAAPKAPAQAGLPRGAPCERSRECASGLCVAFSCE